ncbi:hypothetical protein [Streptomyces sp. CC208A]|uniref:hypothetical protein n=1 Tax=Streptomyces sp. CC208A TaxID=3044573 RepID=UPI0024A901AA|nr:hypothetical protein [Streptomyces sp. CC208A]
MPRKSTPLDAFAIEVAARLPGSWTARYHPHLSDSAESPIAERLWDTGHVDWAVSTYVLGHGAVLTGPAGQELYINEHPIRHDRFLVAALEPPGLLPHHFHGVPEPNGIVIDPNPVRAAAAITRRLLPRYDCAVESVREQARHRPALRAHRQAPAETSAVTLVRYADGLLGAPYGSVPTEAHDALYLSGFQSVPDQGAFLLPHESGPVATAVRIQVLANRLAKIGIGLNYRHPAAAPGMSKLATAPAPALQPGRTASGTSLPSSATAPRSPSRSR